MSIFVLTNLVVRVKWGQKFFSITRRDVFARILFVIQHHNKQQQQQPDPLHHIYTGALDFITPRKKWFLVGHPAIQVLLTACHLQQSNDSTKLSIIVQGCPECLARKKPASPAAFLVHLLTMLIMSPQDLFPGNTQPTPHYTISHQDCFVASTTVW